MNTKYPDFTDYTDSNLGMSNFDGAIDEGLEEKLKEGKFFGQHFGLNFCGVLWFQDGEFHELVQVYGAVVNHAKAATLEELRNLVNEVHGDR